MTNLVLHFLKACLFYNPAKNSHSHELVKLIFRVLEEFLDSEKLCLKIKLFDNNFCAGLISIIEESQD